MKKRNIIIFLVILAFLQFPLFSDEDEHGKPLEEVLALVMEEQNVSTQNDIDPDKVSDDLLEELGDAVMSLNFPNERTHERMDNMMGGSESLRNAHINMGYNYLTDGDWSYGWGMMGNGMMGNGMMGNGMMGNGMMGNGMMGY